MWLWFVLTNEQEREEHDDGYFCSGNEGAEKECAAVGEMPKTITFARVACQNDDLNGQL